MRGTTIAIRLERAEIDGDAGVIRVDALDALQAMYEAGICAKPEEIDALMRRENREMKAALRLGVDRCDSCAHNPIGVRAQECNAADYMCAVCKARKICVCVDCYPGDTDRNKWTWKGERENG